MDDFDLLDATIDPSDLKSMERKNTLEMEIEYEQARIKAKAIFRFAFRSDNPMKIDE